MFRNPYSFSFRHALQIHSDIPRKTPDSACTRLAEKVRIKKEGQSPSKWRRERDSNSRKACAFDGFQDRCNQPLCHLSNNFSTYPSELRSDDGLRLNRGANAPCSPISASLRCQDRCNQPLCHLSNNFSTYPSELRSDDGLRLNRGARRALLADLRFAPMPRLLQSTAFLQNNRGCFSLYPKQPQRSRVF